MDIERRVIPARASLRDANDPKGPGIDGHVALFSSPSPVYYGVQETIQPGFFDDVAGPDADVPSVFNHDQNIVLGRSTATPPTLRMVPDNTGAATGKAGLWTETDINPKSQTVQDLVMQPMSRGDIKGASFAFSLPDQGGDHWAKGSDGTVQRTLVRAAGLHDVSPAVTSPYYPQTAMSLRALRAANELLMTDKGAEPGDLRFLADSNLLAILADPQARMLTQKEMMLVAGAVALLEVLLPDDDGDEDDQALDANLSAAPTADVIPGPIPSSPSGQSLYSLFRSRKKIWRALTWTNLPYKKCKVSGKTTWNGPEEVAKSEVGDLAHMCLGYTSDGSAKGDYAGPHHENAPGYPVNKAGLIAARQRLNQIKGVDVSAGEAHLKKHYNDAGMDWDKDEKSLLVPATVAPEPIMPELVVFGPAYLSLKARLEVTKRMAA